MLVSVAGTKPGPDDPIAFWRGCLFALAACIPFWIVVGWLLWKYA